VGDQGRGRDRESAGERLTAVDVKVGALLPYFVSTEVYFLVGELKKAPSNSPTAVFQIGGGAVFIPLPGVEDIERVFPSIVLGGSFGSLSRPGPDGSRFRFTVEPRIGLYILLGTDRSISLWPRFELSFCVGGARIYSPSHR